MKGSATRKPGDYGEHLDDHREAYWNFEFKPGAYHAEGEAETPKAGVRIYRDAFGVPSVYADGDRNLWFGVGGRSRATGCSSSTRCGASVGAR